MGGEDWDENFGCMIYGGGELSSDKKRPRSLCC
jgi:hypothetical protein